MLKNRLLIAGLFVALLALAAGHLQKLNFESQATTLPKSITKKSLLRIMPLGDSITAGYGESEDGGYRLRLAQMLTSNGYNYTFVGTQTTHNPPGAEQTLHEGHDGWTISQIDGIIINAIKKTNPDLILLMVGTNNMIFNPNNYEKYVEKDYKSLLKHIFATKPKLTVIVSPILSSKKFDDDKADNFNLGGRVSLKPIVRDKNGLNSLVADLASQGYHISFAANMSAKVTKQDLFDGIHPNPTGYGKIATTWMSYIDAVAGIQSRASNK